jgi:hypothetical protein
MEHAVRTALDNAKLEERSYCFLVFRLPDPEMHHHDLLLPHVHDAQRVPRVETYLRICDTAAAVETHPIEPLQ